MPTKSNTKPTTRDEAKACLVPALSVVRDLAVKSGMHFHFMSELDHLVSTAKANVGEHHMDFRDAIEVIASSLCAIHMNELCCVSGVS